MLQLAGKIAVTRPAAIGGTDAATAAAIPAQVVQALVGLGWSERVAIDAVDTVAADAPDADRSSVPALLRRTLAALGPARKEPVSG